MIIYCMILNLFIPSRKTYLLSFKFFTCSIDTQTKTKTDNQIYFNILHFHTSDTTLR